MSTVGTVYQPSQAYLAKQEAADISATVQFNGASSNPTIGNSTVSCQVQKIGRKVCISFRLVTGSTYSAGTGVYNVTLPADFPYNTPAAGAYGVGRLVNSAGSRMYNLSCEMLQGTKVIKFYPAVIDSAGAVAFNTGPVSPSIPEAWDGGSGAILAFQLEYFHT